MRLRLAARCKSSPRNQRSHPGIAQIQSQPHQNPHRYRQKKYRLANTYMAGSGPAQVTCQKNCPQHRSWRHGIQDGTKNFQGGDDRHQMRGISQSFECWQHRGRIYQRHHAAAAHQQDDQGADNPSGPKSLVRSGYYGCILWHKWSPINKPQPPIFTPSSRLCSGAHTLGLVIFYSCRRNRVVWVYLVILCCPAHFRPAKEQIN